MEMKTSGRLATQEIDFSSGLDFPQVSAPGTQDLFDPRPANYCDG
jgi:hypothetical protein